MINQITLTSGELYTNISNEREPTYVSYFFYLDTKLHSWRIQHDSDSPAHGLGGEVTPEFRPHNTAVTVGTGHFAPDGPQLGVLIFLAGDTLLSGRGNEHEIYAATQSDFKFRFLQYQFPRDNIKYENSIVNIEVIYYKT